MPRIKAYKFKHSTKIIIPVDEARVSTAYQCPWTNELFGTKKLYVAHLKALRSSRMHESARKARHRRLRDDFNNQPTYDKIVAWINNHPEFFFDNHYRASSLWKPRDYAQERMDFRIEVLSLRLTWNDSVSNSHSCPRDGVTNWGGRDEDGPRGYPGWRGSIDFKVSSVQGFSSGIFEGTGVCTGSGGSSGDGTLGYEVKLFASDWPALARNREKGITLATLGNKSTEDVNSYAYRAKHIQG